MKLLAAIRTRFPFRLATLCLLLLAPGSRAAAQTIDIYQSYVILKLNGGANTYYDLEAATGNPDFDGASLGSFGPGNSLVFAGGQNRTNKCGGGDVTGGAIYYRVYTQGGSGGAFTGMTMNWVSNDGGSCGGDQTWEVANGTADIALGLGAGNYVLEVYTQATGFPSDNFSSNGGANFKAGFTVTTAGTLPVGLLSFSGCRRGSSNQLTWTTATEQNNRGFAVERSTDGVRFTQVAFVGSRAAGGNSTSDIRYAHTDALTDAEQTASMNWYYRLKQSDLDGRITYSAVVWLKSSAGRSVVIDGIYPNPVTGTAGIRLQAPAQGGSLVLQLSDLAGKLVRTQSVHPEAGSSSTVTMNMSGLAAGPYHLRAVAANGEASAVLTLLKQ